MRARVADGDDLELGDDSLIVAVGSGDSWFGHREWAAQAHGMTTLEDARRLRSSILGAVEMAEASEDAVERAAWQTFVIVGGAPTGVELTGQGASLHGRRLRRDYRAIDTTATRIVPVEHGPAVLGGFPDKLRARAERDLSPTARCPAAPRSSRSATWPPSTPCPGSPSRPSRRAGTPRR